MSSYIKRLHHADTRSINGHVYRFIRSYSRESDARAEAARWNREPGISAKVTGRYDLWTVWVSEKRNWRKK
jgi:hypothetical protein